MPPAAMGLSLFAFFMFACLDASAKWLVTGGYAVLFVVWVRFAIQALFLVIQHRGWSNRRLWRMNNPLLQTIRGISLPAMTVFNFLALQHLQLAESISVLMAAPIVVAVLAGPILGEWAGPKRWAAILTGFAGVLIVVRPGSDIFGLPVVFIICSMLCNSIYFVLTRKLAGKETLEALIFYSCIFAAIGLAPFAIPQASPLLHWSDLIAFAAAGFAGMIGHLALIRASSMADMSKVAPFIYTQVFWMVAFGYVLFGEVPDLWTVVGLIVICASGFYLLMRERQLKQAQS